MPFILRGIQLIASTQKTQAFPKKNMENIIKFSKDLKLKSIYRECNLKDAKKIKQIKLNKIIAGT